MKVFSALCILVVAPTSWGQWLYMFEDFEHANPALYTNLNSGPNNMSIVNFTGGSGSHTATFSGPDGAFYGRSDLHLPIKQGQPWAMRAWMRSMSGSGRVSFGFNDPSGSISCVLSFETQELLIEDNTGFGAAVIGSCPVPALVGFEWYEVTFAYTGIQGYIAQMNNYHGGNTYTAGYAPHSALYTDEGALMIRGYATQGTNHIDYVMTNVPEVNTLSFVAGGLAFALFRLRRRCVY